MGMGSVVDCSGRSSSKFLIRTERSILIKNLLEDLGGDNDEAIPIPNVSAPHLPQPLRIY